MSYTREQLKQLSNTKLFDNITEEITPEALRLVVDALIDACYNRLDDNVNSTMGEEFVVTEDQGSYAPGDIVLATDSIASVNKKMLNKVLYPTFISPSASLSQNGGSLREIGSTHNTLVTLTFNKGSILGKLVNGVWQAGTSQNPRAGRASNFALLEIDGARAANISPSTDQGSWSYEFSNYLVRQGMNLFGGTVTYLEGPQPVDSTSANYQAPLPAGSLTPGNVGYEGVFPIYASTSSITVGTKQTLVSMLTGNNVLLTLVAESGGNKQFFEIPDAWLDARPLVDVEYFNAFTNAYDITNKLADFTVTSTTRTLNGVQFGLKRFTYNGVSRGEQKIRLKF